ncbi:MAG TPA: hypothetical protein VGG20_23680 [Thermoanaerobaculia bacterium]
MKPGQTLEARQRLSRSLLWQWHRGYYHRQGIRAWASGTVPHYISSNPWIAGAYARVAFGWLRDCAAPAPAASGAFAPLDGAHPVHVVELGCGTGRFGYLFVQRLLDLLRRSALQQIRIRYVLTDFTRTTLDRLRSHPSLRPLVDSGTVDFAVYDAGADREIRLLHSREVLAPGTLRNPLAVVANYVLGGLPQDAFLLRAGRLHPGLVTLTSPQAEPDVENPEILSRAELCFEYGDEAVNGDFYGEPDLDSLLQGYRQEVPDTELSFPCSALRCIRNLLKLSDDRLLLLSGDKGYARQESLLANPAPAINVRGGLSMMVNYHAIGRYLRSQGGELLHTSHLATFFNVSAGLAGTPPGGTIETRMAVDEQFERLGPDDFCSLAMTVQESYGAMTLEQLLAWLRLTGGDPHALLGAFAALMKHLPAASATEREELRRLLHQTWEAYFPIEEPQDLPFHLGALFLAIGSPQEAAKFFQRSLDIHGPDPATLYNLGVCHHLSGEPAAALRSIDLALAGAPGFEPAAALRSKILPLLPSLEPAREQPALTGGGVDLAGPDAKRPEPGCRLLVGLERGAGRLQGPATVVADQDALEGADVDRVGVRRIDRQAAGQLSVDRQGCVDEVPALAGVGAPVEGLEEIERVEHLRPARRDGQQVEPARERQALPPGAAVPAPEGLGLSEPDLARRHEQGVERAGALGVGPQGAHAPDDVVPLVAGDHRLPGPAAVRAPARSAAGADQVPGTEDGELLEPLDGDRAPGRAAVPALLDSRRGGRVQGVGSGRIEGEVVQSVLGDSAREGLPGPAAVGAAERPRSMVLQAEPDVNRVRLQRVEPQELNGARVQAGFDADPPMGAGAAAPGDAPIRGTRVEEVGP